MRRPGREPGTHISRNIDRESDRIGLARILAVFRGEVSRPVLLFYRGVLRGFYDVVIADKTINKALSYIYRRFSRTNGLFFREIASETE